MVFSGLLFNFCLGWSLLGSATDLHPNYVWMITRCLIIAVVSFFASGAVARFGLVIVAKLLLAVLRPTCRVLYRLRDGFYKAAGRATAAAARRKRSPRLSYDPEHEDFL
jgi:hypothetical protein